MPGRVFEQLYPACFTHGNARRHLMARRHIVVIAGRFTQHNTLFINRVGNDMGIVKQERIDRFTKSRVFDRHARLS